ncbi:MAG: hypothetical protein GEU74_03435 [Nitriliruptorales bacterium]|nr:hypothetical protein [Nitriliruptorales bacterium]
MRLLETEQQRQAVEAVMQERTRLARELHDVVAHSVTVMMVQAGGAEQLLHRDTAAVGESLANIQNVGRQTIVELRRLLGILREDGHELTTAPQPSLHDLEDLVATIRAAGLVVTVTIEGTRPEVPPSIDLSAYRIVQEGLTNAVPGRRA